MDLNPGKSGRSGMKTKVRKAVATFSIGAFDPETDSLGVPVQSKCFAVGSVVSSRAATSTGRSSGT